MANLLSVTIEFQGHRYESTIDVDGRTQRGLEQRVEVLGASTCKKLRQLAVNYLADTSRQRESA